MDNMDEHDVIVKEEYEEYTEILPDKKKMLHKI